MHKGRGILRPSLMVAAAVTAVAVCTPAEASVLINFAQVGSDVVATTTGSFDQTGLTAGESAGYYGGVNAAYPAFDTVTSSFGVTAFSGLSGPANFGPGNGVFNIANSYSGDFFGFGRGDVRLPDGFVAGSKISAMTTFAGSTFASLGLTPGTYVYTAPNDSFTINIGAVSGVPEPATWALMLIGFGGIGFSMRRGRRVRAVAQLV